MIAAEPSRERGRRGDICCLCLSLNLQIESKPRKESRGRRKVIGDARHGLAGKNYDGEYERRRSLGEERRAWVGRRQRLK